MGTMKLQLRQWKVDAQLRVLWQEYKDTGSQLKYKQILRKESEKKALRKVK